jgi:uncharacterized protein (TIGR03663 family)
MKPQCSASSAKWPGRYCATILVVTIAALAIRLPLLRQRPMHGDEAVHAIQFGDLLEKGVYSYDPYEYHGPTLTYLTLIPACISSEAKLTEVNELTLRIVPVFFGVLLILLLLLAADGLGPGAAIFAAVLTAISPAMVFYSRYYIHEMLLVCFTFGAIVCGYRYAQSKSVGWILLTGIFLGLMHATKETCIIAFGSMALALLLTLIISRRSSPPAASSLRSKTAGVKPIKLSHFVAGFAAAVIVSGLFCSSFLSNPDGLLDSFRTYTTYFSRAHTNGIHIHPWYYYLKMLIYSRYGDGPVWSEAVIVLLAVVGFIVATRAKGIPPLRGCHLLRFIAFYALIMTIVYSALPYKTPWCMLGFLHGMILLAGVGAAALLKLPPTKTFGGLARAFVGALLIVGIAHLGWQAYLGSYKFYADSRNPYVYAHPTMDVFAIVQRIEAIAEVHEDGHNMSIQVVCPEHDYWPLPWYLRFFPNVVWTDKVTDAVVSASLIIASPKVEQELLTKLYQLPPPGKKNLYVPLFDTYTELRPQIELRGYVTKDLWDRFKQ